MWNIVFNDITMHFSKSFWGLFVVVFLLSFFSCKLTDATFFSAKPDLYNVCLYGN